MKCSILDAESLASSFHECMCIFGFKGASTSKVIGARNEMMMDDYDGQMIFGELVGLKLPDIRLTGEEKPRKKPHPGNLSRPGIEPGPPARQARVLPLVPQRWTSFHEAAIKLFNNKLYTRLQNHAFVSKSSSLSNNSGLDGHGLSVC